MSESSYEDNSTESHEWIPISKRPEWQDVNPIPQDEGEVPVVRIAYSEKFTEVYDYYRAIVCSKEVSQRALDLTREALELNPANYSVWHHRRSLLQALGSDIKDELNYIRGVIEDNPKNYQVWQHRHILVDWLQDPSNELRLTEIILSKDAKNYHAWQYRQWVVKQFNLYNEELPLIERLLDEDIRNNSAWNHRFFVASHQVSSQAKDLGVQFKGDVLLREVDFAFKAIEKLKENESAWNYLNGLLSNVDESEKAFLQFKIFGFCEDLFKDDVRSPFLISTLLDLESQFAVAEVDKERKAEHANKALKLCNSLANEVDPLRKEYWNFIAKTIEIKTNE